MEEENGKSKAEPWPWVLLYLALFFDLLLFLPTLCLEGAFPFRYSGVFALLLNLCIGIRIGLARWKHECGRGGLFYLVLLLSEIVWIETFLRGVLWCRSFVLSLF